MDIKEIMCKAKNFSKNNELLNQIYELVISENDKYPKRSMSNEFFPIYKIMRNRSKISNNNILKLFDDSINKRNSAQIAQYSFSKEDLIAKKSDNNIYYCLHHNDMDGEASASVVINDFSIPSDKIKFYSIPYNYNENEFRNLLYRIKRNKLNNPNKKFILYVVDLSLRLSELVTNLLIFDKVIWIDHHVTSLTMVNNIPNQKLYEKLSYIIDTRFCATFLSRFFLKKGVVTDDELFYNNMEIPYLINAFDLKTKEYECGTYLNSYYFSFGNINGYSSFWYYLINNLSSLNENDDDRIKKINKVISIGKELNDLDLRKNKLMFDNDFKYIFNINTNNLSIPKFRVVALYQHGTPNKITGFDDDIPTIKLLVRFNEKESSFYFSLYTDSDILGKLNLGKILIKYGLGGGHPKACGGTLRYSDFYKLYTNIERLLEDKKIIKNYRNYKLEGVTRKWNTEFTNLYKQINYKKNNNHELDENNISIIKYELDIDMFSRLIAQIIGDEIIMMK